MEDSHYLTKVLVVDDERDIRDGCERVLSRLGFEVDTAANGEEGLAALEKEPSAIVLLDLKMPGLDGMEVLRRLRESYPEVLVIIVTGFATVETAIEAMKLGAYDFITKPFKPDELRLTVARAAEHQRVKEERDRLWVERERGLWAITTEKSRLKTVINSMAEGVLITDRELRILLCNPAFIRLIGLAQDCAVGTCLDQVAALTPLHEMARQLSQDQSRPQAITKEVFVDKPRATYLRASINTIAGEGGEALGLVTLLQDVTDMKELERKKSEFVAMVTHELRAPLAAVDTQFEVVLKGLAGELTDKQRHLLSRMRKRLGGTLELINDLLDLSRMEARTFVQEKKMVGINPIIREAAEMMEAEVEEKGLTLALYLAPDLPQILVDPQSIREVVVNLLSNAVRYTPAEGLIQVSSGFDAGYVHFTVADTGIGIPKEDLDKIFDRFYRVKSEKTRNVIGTGLGLPIVEAIVKDHLGFVRVASEPDKGTVFRVMLPAVS